MPDTAEMVETNQPLRLPLYDDLQTKRRLPARNIKKGISRHAIH